MPVKMNSRPLVAYIAVRGQLTVMNYELKLLDEVVGNVSVKETGLYTVFECLCKLPIGKLLRVTADYSNKSVSLGICLWENNHYRCLRKLTTKKLGDGQPEFCVVEIGDDAPICDFSIVDAQKPFAKIQRLPHGRLVTKQGIAKILFRDPTD